MKRKKYDDDDDRTIVNMNVDGMKGYLTDTQKKNIEEIRQLNLTKKEKRALFWGGILATIPVMIAILIGFCVAFFIVRLWLMQGL